MNGLGPMRAAACFLAIAAALASTAASLAAQVPQPASGRPSGPPIVEETTLALEDGSVMRYAIALNGSFFNAQRKLEQYSQSAY